ncbi:sentrin-specific protease 6 isoform X2 [Pimephales promelas]|uniref:sentrin-specific protease 6 isoform X2 n=1 Tax=Pimephales promelas TaxID=90988 RepID=UPI001955D6A2|nr:sentrin-specific protease 6 isoform X2 [Pimephales promelas]
MNHKKSIFIEALDKCEDRRDGGFKQSWRCSLSDDSEDDSRHDAALMTMERVSGQQELSPEGIKTPSMKSFSANGSVETHERRPNQLRALNRSGKPGEAAHSVSVSAVPSRTSYLIMSPAPSQGVMVQGRLFQHAQFTSPSRKMEQRSDLIQRVELENILLTCPPMSDSGELNIKRRAHQKRRTMNSSPVEPLQPDDYLTVCGKCGQPSEDHVKCDHCGNVLPAETPSAVTSSMPPRPSGPAQTPSLQISRSFYGPTSGGCSHQLDVIINPSVRIAHGNLLLPHNGRAVATSGSSVCNGHKPAGGKKQQATKLCELNDPIVLSSDEDEDSDNVSSTGTVNRLDSVSPRPADSAHSSPAPSGGRVEAAVKAAGEHEDPSADFFTQANHRNPLPRRSRMRDSFGNTVCEDPSPSKKRKMEQLQVLSSIILECRSVRIGTLRRMVTKPVVFTVDYIQLETEGPEVDVLESVYLKSSELTFCEWCNVRKLPVLFLQTSSKECQRLQAELQMSKENEGIWYDCNGNNDEKYIVLIFECGPSMQEQMILEDILAEIGRNNKLADFPKKIGFDEANVRLVEYNKASEEKVKVKDDKTAVSATPSSPSASFSVVTVTVATANPAPTVPVPSAAPSFQTRMSARLLEFCEEEDEMAELQPTFTGPIVKLLVYPPPPAKGGISVTNEDLHCLNDGEFLNDVIIDFYLKYLFLEKLKKEDAGRSHVFSSFFYKRLNQRERRNAADTSSLPIQKRKHNRVKTWTRHVDLFQKDFIFVPINESAHWYLAVICFPGLEKAHVEPNPLYQPQAPVASPAASCGPPTAAGADELEDHSQHTAVPHRSAADATRQQYTDGLHRIIECYRADDSQYSDDQSSCPDECSDDGTLVDDTGSSDRAEWTSRPTICKQPCILIMDSLRGPTRSTVVKTLRQYLEVEWEVKKGSQRSFGKEVMKGSSPRVPQQDNFSDCGVYVLQYVESFFENPLPSFDLPMNLLDWFPQQRMKTKREEIKELILKIQTPQQLSLESETHPDAEDTLESADLIPPISS